MSWWHDAECKGMDSSIFFPDAGGFSMAKEVCRRCPVQVECLRDAMDTEGDRRFGIRGGLTPIERDELRRRRRVPCEECGEPFVASHPGHRFCSASCRERHGMRRRYHARRGAG